MTRPTAKEFLKMSDKDLDSVADALAAVVAARAEVNDIEVLRGDRVKRLIDAQNRLEAVLK